MTALLITQCLQNDFVQPVGRYEPLPNSLHVGHEEARRLMGDHPEQGPVQRIIEWAYSLPDERLKVIHIRDWHDASDQSQTSHLKQFGPHCLKDKSGSAFAFREPKQSSKQIAIVNSLTLVTVGHWLPSVRRF